MNKYAIWLASGKTTHLWARSMAQAWTRYPTAIHVQKVDSELARARRTFAKVRAQMPSGPVKVHA